MRGDFFDTNVLVYAASKDGNKASIADRLIDTGGVCSVQVLNEFASAAYRKRMLDWPGIREYLNGVRLVLAVQPLLPSTHDTALRIAETYRLNFYDGSIIAAALEAGCQTLYSEDMHSGLVIEDRLTILNPFV